MLRGVCAAVFVSLIAVSAAAQSVDVFVNKTAPASAPAGATITYVVTIGNSGPNAASSVTLSDALPAGVTFVSYTQTGPAFLCSTPASGTNGTISCSIATLASGAGAEFDIAVHLDSGLAAGTVVSNTAAATTSSSDTNANNNSAMASTTISAESDMFVFKSAPATAATGTNITFTVTAGNAGPNDAPNAHFDDVLPADVGFVSINQTTGPTFTCTTPAAGSSGTVTCTIATLTSGTTAQFDIVVSVDPKAAGTTLINTVSAASDNPDGNSENNTSVTGTSVPGGNLADLRILKTGPVSQPADTDVTYTITLVNDGPNDATTVSWTDTLPNSIPPSSPLTFVSFNQNSGPAFNCGSPGPTTTCSIPTFPAGSTATFTLVAHIPPGTTSGHTYTNVVNVTSDNDPNPDNDTSSTTVTVSSADVGVTKSGPATAVAGGPAYDYIVTLSNGGPDAATDVSFSDTLPAGLTFVGVVQNTGPAASCNGGQIVACTISLLGNGQSAQFTITVQPQPTIANGTVLTNTATASTSSGDTNPNNDSSTVMTTVSANADVAIVKSAPAAATAGNNITYGVTVTNNGPSTASSVAWNDTLPAGTTFVSFQQTSGPAFTCTAGAAISCSIATLAPGATAVFSITARISPSTAAGTLSNTANVTSSTPDATNGNNSSTVNTTVSTSADVSVVKTGPATAVAGTNITYTIVVTNNGPSDAQLVGLGDSEPLGTTFVSGNQTSGSSFGCPPGAPFPPPPPGGPPFLYCGAITLPAGATATFSMTVTVNGTDANGTIITNTAGASTQTTPDPNPGNNASTVLTTVSASADLSVTKNGPAATPSNTTITYTVTAANAGPSNAAAVSLSETVPNGMTFVSVNQTSGPAFTCSGTGPIVCTIATFNAGASAAFQFTFNVPLSLAPGTTSSDTATITSSTPDSNLSNNTATATTTVGQSIPALSPLAMALLAVMLAMIGWMTARR